MMVISLLAMVAVHVLLTQAMFATAISQISVSWNVAMVSYRLLAVKLATTPTRRPMMDALLARSIQGTNAQGLQVSANCFAGTVTVMQGRTVMITTTQILMDAPASALSSQAMHV
jgi:hypothetical protein